MKDASLARTMPINIVTEDLGALPPECVNVARVIAVAVTYQPDLVLFRQAVRACRHQVTKIFVIDNGSTEQCQNALAALCEDEVCSFAPLGHNFGIAAAQNHGILLARSVGASQVLLLDQDSVAAPDMVARLLDVLTAGLRAGRRVAAVGPRLVDRRSGKVTPFVRIGLFGVSRLICSERSDVALESDFLVASGSIIPLSVFDEIGIMEEGLFIDNVDLEWCFRSRHHGFVLLGACKAVLEHSVGEQVFHVAGRSLYRHSPLRQYYIMRNRILLYRRPYSPWAWVMQDFLRMLVKVVLFGVVYSPRIKNLRMMMRGMIDGLRGRHGPFSE
jgi:rhamnosyltransferase